MDFKKVWGVIVRMTASLMPRDKHLIVYGGAMDLFIDNAKHLFILYNEQFGKGYRHVWLTRRKNTYDSVNSLGLPVVRTDSLHGLWIILRAGTVIFDNNINSFANHDLTMGALRICLWHGIGFKMVGSAVSDEQKPYQPKGWFYEKYLAKHVHGDYFFSTCEMRKRIYSFSFLISMDKILIAGYPRMRCFFMNEDERRLYVRRYESKLLQDFYVKLSEEKASRIIYMPTFRDADKNYINKAIPDWGRLNETLAKSNSILYLKVHRMTPTPEIDKYTNIVILGNSLDIYPLLPLFDLLISDYSSIMSDFAILKKPMLFYTYDLEDYIRNSRNIFRNFYTVHSQLPVVNTFEGLCDFVINGKFKYVSSDLENYFESPRDFNVARRLIEKLSR